MSTLTGTQVLLLVASETGHVYTFATPKLQPLITKQEGKNLIQACLNSPDSHSSIPEYLPVVSGSTGPIPTSQYDNELGDDELTPRSASTVVTSAQLQPYLPVNTTTTNTTTTPPSNSSAASVAAAAAAAQVFMSSAHPSQYAAYSHSNSTSSGPYWNGNPNSGAMYAPVPGKSTQQSQQQLQQLQQSQQQQLYHAMYQQQHHQQQQQQQLYQQYQKQQQHHHHHQQHYTTKQSESEDHQ